MGSDQPASEAAVRAIATASRLLETRVTAHTDRIAQYIHDQCLEELGVGATITTGTRAAVRGNVAGFAQLVRSAQPVAAVHASADALAYAGAYVHRRYPLSLLLRTYRLGHAALWDTWREVLESVEPDAQIRLEAVEHSAPVLFDFIEAVTGEVVHAYESEAAEWLRSMDAIRADVVASLLADGDVSQAAAENVLLYRLDTWHLGLVIAAAEDAGPEAETPDGFAERAFTFAEPIPRLSLRVNSRLVWLWFGGTPDVLGDLAERIIELRIRSQDLTIAMGEPAFGLAGFRETYDQALHARRVAALVRRPLRHVARFRTLAIPAMATAEPSLVRWFTRRTLGSLGGDDDESARLRATLAVYFEEGESQKHTAQRLGIHANTVTYRLRQCEAKLGYAPSSKRLELELALSLAPYVGEADESDGDRDRVSRPPS